MKDILPVAISVHFLPRLSVISAPYNDSFSATGLQCLQCSPESPAQCDPDNNQETYPKNNCDQAKDACIWSWTGNLMSNPTISMYYIVARPFLQLPEFKREPAAR